MSGLLIGGAGGHGKVVADAALSLHMWERLAFVDDRAKGDVGPLGLPIVGTFETCHSLLHEYSAIVIAIGNARKRLQLLCNCEQAGFLIPVVKHGTAAVSSFADVGTGTVVLAQAAINVGAHLGKGCIVNTGASVDHDCELGDGVHVCPGARLAGDVHVGPRTWIGIGSVVREGVLIGADVTVGAGSVVIADVPSGETVMGVPAKSRGR